jgi:hypothetical protein
MVARFAVEAHNTETVLDAFVLPKAPNAQFRLPASALAASMVPSGSRPKAAARDSLADSALGCIRGAPRVPAVRAHGEKSLFIAVI